MAKVRGLPSPEEPVSTTPTGVSSLVMTCCGLATTGAATAPYPVSVAGAEVCVEDEPIEAVTVVARPARMVRAPLQLPRTTLERLGVMGPELKVPPPCRSVPPSEEEAAVGTSVWLVRFLPQTTKVWSTPAGAVRFAGGHGAPGAAGAEATTTSSTWKEYAVTPSPPGTAAGAGARSSSSEASDPPTATRKVPVRSAAASPAVEIGRA